MFQPINEEGMIDLEYHHFQSLMQTSDKEKNQVQFGFWQKYTLPSHSYWEKKKVKPEFSQTARPNYD